MGSTQSGKKNQIHVFFVHKTNISSVHSKYSLLRAMSAREVYGISTTIFPFFDASPNAVNALSTLSKPRKGPDCSCFVSS